MSEFSAFHYCENCGCETPHLFSGSGKGGVCEICDTKLPKEERYDGTAMVDEWSEAIHE